MILLPFMIFTFGFLLIIWAYMELVCYHDQKQWVVWSKDFVHDSGNCYGPNRVKQMMWREKNRKRYFDKSPVMGYYEIRKKLAEKKIMNKQWRHLHYRPKLVQMR